VITLPPFSDRGAVPEDEFALRDWVLFVRVGCFGVEAPCDKASSVMSRVAGCGPDSELPVFTG
jgi:hypothetical protein